MVEPVPTQLFTIRTRLNPGMKMLTVRELSKESAGSLPVLADSTLGSIVQSKHPQATFQMTPAGQSGMFQVAQRDLTMVPWRYFVLSPVSTVTAVANQQLFNTLVIAFIVLVLAAFTGLIVGQF